MDGAYKTANGLMVDSLRLYPDFPLTEPYTALGFQHGPGGGGETTTAGVLAVSGNDAIVDWVFLELRSTPTQVIATRSALLQRDGDIVDVDGTSNVSFDAPSGNYHVTVRHRNHLSVTTATPVVFTGSTCASVDFTSSSLDVYNQTAPENYDPHERKVVGAVRTLWAGNANGDGFVNSSDQTSISNRVLNDPGNLLMNSNYVVFGYHVEDVNLDHRVIAAGPNNDPNFILTTVFLFPLNTTFDANYTIQEQRQLASIGASLCSGTQTFALTGLPSDGVQDIDVTAAFANDNACAATLTDAYDAPESCACGLTTAGATPVCNDNGTGTPTDDYYTISTNPSGTGVGTQYNVTVVHNGNTTNYGPYNYGSASAAFGNFLISQGNAQVTITDATTGTCSLGPVTVSAPAICSVCNFPTVSFVPVPGNCNGITPFDNGRIVLTAATNATHFGISTAGASVYNGVDFSSATPISSLPVDVAMNILNAGATYIVRIFNGENTCYQDYTVVVPPAGCPIDPMGQIYAYCSGVGTIITGGTISVSGPGTYVITLDGSTGSYQFYTDGTPGVYTITYNPPAGYTLSTTQLPAVGAGTGGALDPTTGSADNPTSEDPLVIGSASAAGMLVDPSPGANPYYLNIDLAPGDPEVFNNNIPLDGCCINTPVTLGTIVCNSNNTPSVGADDYLTFTLDPEGSGLGTAYAVSVSSGSITPTTAAYGSPTTFRLQAGSAGAGNVTVTIRDLLQPTCEQLVLITDPGGCVCPPGKCLPVKVVINKN